MHGSTDMGQPVSGSFMVTVNASATLYRVGDLPRAVTAAHGARSTTHSSNQAIAFIHSSSPFFDIGDR